MEENSLSNGCNRYRGFLINYYLNGTEFCPRHFILTPHRKEGDQGLNMFCDERSESFTFQRL